jgi:hypothetical protein
MLRRWPCCSYHVCGRNLREAVSETRKKQQIMDMAFWPVQPQLRRQEDGGWNKDDVMGQARVSLAGLWRRGTFHLPCPPAQLRRGNHRFPTSANSAQAMDFGNLEECARSIKGACALLRKHLRRS